MISYSLGSGTEIQSIIVADFNGDDRPDLAVVSFNTANIGVLIGNGDGTFQAPIMISTGNSSEPSSFVVGDFNSDGRPDLAFVGAEDFIVGVLFGYGDGTFGSLMTYSNRDSRAASLIVAGDFNNDDHLDLAVDAYWGYGSIGVLLGSSDGTFRTQTRFNFNNGVSSSFAVGDFDGDGQLDLAITDSFNNCLYVLLGNGNGYFDQPIVVSTGSLSDPQSVAVGDFNNDSQLDVATANYKKNSVGVWLGNGNGTFRGQTTYFTGDSSYPAMVVTGDFNNDDQLDIAVSNTRTHYVGVFLGIGNGTFLAQTMISIGASDIPDLIAAGDFNSDGKLDIAIVDSSQCDVIILLNTCDCCIP